MARLWAMFSVGLLLTITLMIVAAGMVGRWRNRDILLYGLFDLQTNSNTIYLLDVEQHITTQWTIINGARFMPSPDGRLAIEKCDPSCGLSVWDGVTTQTLTVDLANNLYLPTWSPDGRLAFVAEFIQSSNIQVWDGTALENLTHTSNTTELFPTWSADGQLAFSSCDDHDCDVMIWDNHRIYNLTNTPNLREQSIAWSRDGHLAIVVRDESSSLDIWLWDGATIRNLTMTPSAYESSPSWSPDGQLAFVSCINTICNSIIWDGITMQNLTNTLNFETVTPITWSNSGHLILLACYGEDCDLMLWDGDNIVQLTHTPTLTETSATWLP